VTLQHGPSGLSGPLSRAQSLSSSDDFEDGEVKRV
jgi:hypothetical protein